MLQEHVTSRLVRFYSGNGTDHKGRKLSDMWFWKDEDMEFIHDYIQWMFPTAERSSCQPNAPVLTSEDRSHFQNDDLLLARMKVSLYNILGFYGFDLSGASGKITIRKNKYFTQKSDNWLRPGNHNFWRITRILKCLMLVNLVDYAEAFLVALEDVYKDHSDTIGDETIKFWREAVEYV